MTENHQERTEAPTQFILGFIKSWRHQKQIPPKTLLLAGKILIQTAHKEISRGKKQKGWRQDSKAIV
jgi:hypothetical protein